MSSAELEEIIDIGNIFISSTARRYYTIATFTVFFYDFLLTLADEIKYGWQGKKSWVFAIFLANRHLPVGYQVWLLYMGFGTTFHQRLCEKTVFVKVLAIVIITLLAQAVITLRIYAITRKNRAIVLCLGVIMISQLILGLYLTADTARRGPSPILPVPLPIYMMCTFTGNLSAEIAFIAMTLVYDVLAFSVIVYLVIWSNVNNVPVPGLFKIIARDATYYFLIIFASHLAAVMFLAFASDPIKLLPAPGNHAFLSVMVTRLLLSLKKADAPNEHEWSPTTHTTIEFADHRLESGVTSRDEIHLVTFSSTQEGTESKE